MTIVPVSEWLDNQLRYSFLNDYDSRVIQNGIDLQIFKPSKSQIFIEDNNLQNKYIILGVASVWTERKGFFEFIKLRELLGDEFAIVLVGVSFKTEKNASAKYFINFKNFKSVSIGNDLFLFRLVCKSYL